MTPRFDPTRAIIYDLARGQLRDEEGTERLNLPVHLILRLCEHAGPDALSDFASGLGHEVGRRIADRLGEHAADASVEAWTEHLGGQLALLGLGDLTVEQWGKALVFHVRGAPKGTDGLLSKALVAALSRALGRDAATLRFEREDGVAFLLLSPERAEQHESAVASGASLGEIVEALHRGAA